jgi:hypothetical protein
MPGAFGLERWSDDHRHRDLHGDGKESDLCGRSLGSMARLAGAGVTVLALTRADFGKLIADETEKWGRLVFTALVSAGVSASFPWSSR